VTRDGQLCSDAESPRCPFVLVTCSLLHSLETYLPLSPLITEGTHKDNEHRRSFLDIKTADDLDSRPSPRTESLVASAVRWAERIMRKIDKGFTSK
jgi:hypothetical protein